MIASMTVGKDVRYARAAGDGWMLSGLGSIFSWERCLSPIFSHAAPLTSLLCKHGVLFARERQAAVLTARAERTVRGADWAGVQGCGRALSEGREVNPAHTAGDSGLLCFENRKCVFYFLLLFSVLTLSACLGCLHAVCSCV